MLQHIVFIRLDKDYSQNEKITILEKLQLMLNDLPKHIEEIKHLETGLNISSRGSAFDLSLSVELSNEADLESYRIHPKHKDVLNYMSSLKLETAVVDYIK
jgi:hypothetical protein